MAEKRGKWQKLSSEIAFKNPYYQVRRDSVIKPDGSKGFYDVVETKGAVLIVALDDEQNVHLVGMHRYTNDNFSYEIPAGGMDNDNPLTAAKRELEEETGLVAENWKQLGLTFPANGLMSEDNYTFLATGLAPAKGHAQEEEGIVEVKKAPIKQAFAMIKNGEITDSQSIAALTLAALELKLWDTNE